MKYTPKQFAHRLRQRRSRLVKDLEEAARATGKDLLTEARRLSRGTISTAESRMLDYLYATRHGGSRVPGDPAIINFQQGDFYMGWHLLPLRWTAGGDLRLTLRNDSEAARWLLEGTKYAIARPFDERIIERVEYRWRARIWRAYMRNLYDW